MVEVSLTVGKLDASLALLLTKDHHLIEFPTILLPNGVKAGSIVKIKCDQDLESEREEAKQFQKIQDTILNTFGTNVPQNPVLKIRNITQTSCVLEWDALDLGTASLKNLFLIKNSKKLGAIPQPLTNRTTKLSGLPIDKTFQFQLRLDTTAGVYSSEVIEVTTHKMTDLSGITVCLGDISVNDPFTVADIEETLKNMGARYPLQDKIQVDTTHFICTRENTNNPEYLKACDMNIPVVRPEWLKTCERERRIVGVRDYYTKDCSLPDILAKNYWKKDVAISQEVDKKTEVEGNAPAENGIEAKSLPEVKIDSPVENEADKENRDQSLERLDEINLDGAVEIKADEENKDQSVEKLDEINLDAEDGAVENKQENKESSEIVPSEDTEIQEPFNEADEVSKSEDGNIHEINDEKIECSGKILEKEPQSENVEVNSSNNEVEANTVTDEEQTQEVEQEVEDEKQEEQVAEEVKEEVQEEVRDEVKEEEKEEVKEEEKLKEEKEENDEDDEENNVTENVDNAPEPAAVGVNSQSAKKKKNKKKKKGKN